jgi:hypothetical protein
MTDPTPSPFEIQRLETEGYPPNYGVGFRPVANGPSSFIAKDLTETQAQNLKDQLDLAFRYGERAGLERGFGIGYDGGATDHLTWLKSYLGFREQDQIDQIARRNSFTDFAATVKDEYAKRLDDELKIRKSARAEA